MPSSNTSILVVDDSAVDLEIISIACAALNCSVDCASGATEALALFRENEYSLVLTDYKMHGMNGVDLICCIKEINPDVPCVIITGYPDARIRQLHDAGQISNVVTKPIQIQKLIELVRIALEQSRGATEQLGEIALENRMDRCVALLGESEGINDLRKELPAIIDSAKPLLLIGAPGVGAQYIARFIHDHGAYAKSPYVECICDGMDVRSLHQQLITRDGKWSKLLNEARDGTLVLHHVEELPREIQNLLAAEFKEIAKSMRVICLANRSLDDLMDEGLLEDRLYFALAHEELVIPPLSSRLEDVRAIMIFIARAPKRFGLSRPLTPKDVFQLVTDIQASGEVPGNLNGLRKLARECANRPPLT